MRSHRLPMKITLACRVMAVLLPVVAALVTPQVWPSAGAAESPPPDSRRSSPVPFWRSEWPRTDFSKASVDFEEIISGGPPRDGIPPIDHPKFVSVAAATEWVQDQEPVLVLEGGGEARAYPLQILMWHEIVNDTLGDTPVLITFCPLCNSALVFERRVAGRVLDFGTTGKLRHSDLVMWDRQTESWWQQLGGTCIVGEFTGTMLKDVPAPLVAFETFRNAFPNGKVLSRETGHERPYGVNPYAAYDSPTNARPFLMRGALDQRLPVMERVVALALGGEARAYPYAQLRGVGVVNDRIGGEEVAIFFRLGTRSALDAARMADSRDVGTGAAFLRRVDGRVLTFAFEHEAWTDRQTGSVWDFFGRAIHGPLKGQRLTSLPHGNHFAFAWLAFRPDTTIWRAP